MKPKIGLITFSESRADVYEARKPMMDQEIRALTASLDGAVELVRTRPVRFKADLLAALEALRTAGIVGAILHVPIFTPPNLVVLAARLLDVPVIVAGNTRADSHSTVAFLAAVGGIEQAGLAYDSILAETSSADLRGKITSFGRAAAAKAGLRGRTFGVFGGRTLGINTGTADPAQWIGLFGVDIQHIDQSEIIRRGREIPAALLAAHRDWLAARLGRLEYDGNRLTPETLDRQIRSYLATKEIAREMRLDFIGVKCQTELSDHYALQCVNCALQNDPYDAEGPKEPTPCSCEADHDGALTMQILNLIAGGQPTALLDLRHVPERGPIALANCGSLPTWFAARSAEPAENLAQVHLIPHVFGRAGGGALQFVFADGPVTLARLTRSGGRYRMVIVKGKTRLMDRAVLHETTWAFPHAFVEGDFEGPALLGTMKANHLHLTAGDHVDALAQFCRMMGLECEVLG